MGTGCAGMQRHPSPHLGSTSDPEMVSERFRWMPFSAYFIVKDDAEPGLGVRAGNRVRSSFWHMLPQFSSNRVTGNGRQEGAGGHAYVMHQMLYSKGGTTHEHSKNVPSLTLSTLA